MLKNSHKCSEPILFSLFVVRFMEFVVVVLEKEMKMVSVIASMHVGAYYLNYMF